MRALIRAFDSRPRHTIRTLYHAGTDDAWRLVVDSILAQVSRSRREYDSFAPSKPQSSFTSAGTPELPLDGDKEEASGDQGVF